jgi:hypothetical protein
MGECGNGEWQLPTLNEFATSAKDETNLIQFTASSRKTVLTYSPTYPFSHSLPPTHSLLPATKTARNHVQAV